MLTVVVVSIVFPVFCCVDRHAVVDVVDYVVAATVVCRCTCHVTGYAVVYGVVLAVSYVDGECVVVDVVGYIVDCVVGGVASCGCGVGSYVWL